MPWIGSVQPHLCDIVKACTTEFKYGDVWECPDCKKQWVAKYFKSPYGHPTGNYSLTLEELDKDKYLPRDLSSFRECHQSPIKLGEPCSGTVKWGGIWFHPPGSICLDHKDAHLTKKVHSIHKCHPSLMKIGDVISTCSCGREWLLTTYDSGSGEWNGTCIYDKEN